MTTTVIVEAHCSEDKEVVIHINDLSGMSSQAITIQNGETYQQYVYDDRVILVRESLKQ